MPPRDSMDREGGGTERELMEPAIRALDGDVRHSSTPISAEIEIKPHSMHAPLTSAERLSKGPTCRH